MPNTAMRWRLGNRPHPEISTIEHVRRSPPGEPARMPAPDMAGHLHTRAESFGLTPLGSMCGGACLRGSNMAFKSIGGRPSWHMTDFPVP